MNFPEKNPPVKNCSHKRKAINKCYDCISNVLDGYGA